METSGTLPPLLLERPFTSVLLITQGRCPPRPALRFVYSLHCVQSRTDVMLHVRNVKVANDLVALAKSAPVGAVLAAYDALPEYLRAA